MRPRDNTSLIATKRARRKVIHDLSLKLIRGQNDIVSESLLIYPWLTRHMVNGHVRRLKLKGQSSIATVSVTSNLDILATAAVNSGGRPRGCTAISIIDRNKKIEIAKDRIAILCSAEKNKNEGCLKRGSYQKIHQAVIKDLQLPNTCVINRECIKSRLRRQSLHVDAQKNKTTPLLEVEPLLVQFALWKQEANQPITASEGLLMANSLIDGTPIQTKLKTFQSSINAAPTGIVSAKFWSQFLKRNKQKLEVGKGYRVAANRTEWVTYDNIDQMYNLVYEQMVKAGVAKYLLPEDYYYVNDQGEKVESESESVGALVKIEVTHPQWILFGDEVGTDISQKNDGNVGGQRFVTQKGTRANVKSSHKDGRFTAIGLTAGSGEPVMAIIIFAAEELTFEQRMGHDIRIPYDNNGSVSENSGPGKVFPGGPCCLFRGKMIPALITCSKKGSITSDILKAAFERLDELGIYERTASLTPFALFDAHDSRLQVPFLKYINDQLHLWIFCIGLPNGTHKWQVGDSREQNGSWKVEWVREKSKLVLYRTRMGLYGDLEKSDILPLINIIWSKSFGRIRTNRKAISDRGWNPLNRRLLYDPEILKTRIIATTNPLPIAITAPPLHTDITPIELPPSTILPTIEPSPATLATIEPSESVITARGCDNTMTSTIGTEVIPSPWIDLTNINFDRGLAGEFTIDILQHIIRKEKVRENLNARYNEGQVVRGRIDETRRLTGGSMFKSNHIVLDEEVLRYRENKEEEKNQKLINTIQKAINEYNKRKLEYDKIMAGTKQEKDYGVAEYKSVIHFKKWKSDAAVPTSKAALTRRYEDTKGRTAFTMQEYLTDRGYDKDEESIAIITRLLGTTVEHNELPVAEAQFIEEMQL